MFWLLEPAKPVRVYSQGAYGYMQPVNGSYDSMWSIVTMDNGMLVIIGGGWNLPPSYPNFCSTWIEITGTEGALILDDTHRDNWLNTVAEGTRFPMSTMPGEQVDHVFAGQMGPETIHFLESCILDRPVDGDAGERAHGDGDLHRRRSLRRAQRAGRPAAVERVAVAGRRHGGSTTMRRQAKDIGLAIIGAGRVGLFRGEVAARHPAVEVDRHRREEPQPRTLRRGEDRRRFRHRRITASCSSGRR